MHVSPQEIKAIKENLARIKAIDRLILKHEEERTREIDILDRRVSFLTHPAGKGRSETNSNILMFDKKEN